MTRNKNWLKLEEIVKQIVNINPESFELIWNNIMIEFISWFKSVGNMTSELTSNLELLRKICEAYQECDIKDDIRVIDLILIGALPVGKTIKLKSPDGEPRNFTVIRREISDNFMVKYTLKSEDGIIMTREYVD